MGRPLRGADSGPYTGFPMAEVSKQTPMMRQYLRFKADYPDTVLFFHLGDFYETFFDDAKLAARELDIVLTSRNGHPMAGVPIRRGEAYMNQLLKRGYKVAVCQQVEDPKKAKGLVKRDVVRVVTPGTAIDESVLEDGANNYLCAVDYSPEGGRHGVAFLDLSTGEFTTTVAEENELLGDEIARRRPSEILLAAAASVEATGIFDDLVTTRVPAVTFNADVPESSAVGAIEESSVRAAGAILAYVKRTQKGIQAHIRPLQSYNLSDHMDLDPFTVNSLELVKPLRSGQERGTLLHVLDHTVTGMGRRRLRRILLAPWTDLSTIEARLDAMEVFVQTSLLRQNLRDRIKEVHDLERLSGRLGAGRMRPFDLGMLLHSLEVVPTVADALSGHLGTGKEQTDVLRNLCVVLRNERIAELQKEFAGMLVDQPPPTPRDGPMIRPGYSTDLDALRETARALKAQLASLEQDQRKETGIPSLKVGYNRVFGYYLEVTKTHLDKVPEAYRRRQTLANAERFVTEELQGIEERIALANEQAESVELALYEEALAKLTTELPLLQEMADALADLDVLLSLAEIAHRNRYIRPAFTREHALRIRGGRHPVVECLEEFVPNDLDLPPGRDLVILTGPNMAGKSVYLRQAALLCLMAQAGSFVPAEEAVLPIVDRVFARVGASDMLVEGISTFMMEMLEVSAILERATARSLIILDEMGRGTSTFDGVSIAWAVASELATSVRAKTLFATHYQELTRLTDDVPNAVNLHVAVKEVGKDIVFLHRVEPGTAAGSYGVHVARLAGLPAHITENADRILNELLTEAPLSHLGEQPHADVLPLFGNEDHPVVQKLRKLDPNTMTPLQALAMLADLRDQLD